MPKLIPELRSMILQAARRHLLEDENHDITMRQLALDCGTAVGTVYNYFTSKEVLISEAMMSDWTACISRMQAGAENALQPLEGMQAIVDALHSFDGRYQPIWKNYAGTSSSVESLWTRHEALIRAIAEPVKTVLVRFGFLFDPNLPEVLSELGLMAARTEDGFARIAPVLERILR